ncbi:MAG: M56 family metallopeptidase, partial [Clostridia bacterium]|nr:M56 family metallopeptidase [Clostridia bacterium]
MKELFLSLVNISITAGYLILAAILLRLLLARAPKWIRGILWALVGVRLIFPFSLESALSLIPSAETVPQSVLVPGAVPAVTSGFPAVDGALNPVLSAALEPETAPGAGVPLWRTLADGAWIVWLAGLGLMLLYAVISTARIRRSVREAVPGEEKGVWLCDAVRSPFILGVIRPRIYLPSLPLGGEAESYLIAHEKAHLRRGDHLWKPLGFVLLCVYWFNPLCWLAYVLLCRDIELACDERVIRDLDRGQIADYSEALLRFSVPRRRIAACPLAFGEVGVKTRIRSALSYKKPAFWIVIAALLACVAAAVCLLTVPKKPEADPAALAATLQALTDGQKLWGGGTFPYLQAVLDGKIDYSAPKLNEKAIREILAKNGGIGENGKAQNGDFDAILADIAAIQPYPDYQTATVSASVT